MPSPETEPRDNTCAKCSLFFKPHGCDLFGRDTDADAPMCPNGDSRPANLYCGNSVTFSIEDDPDAFGRADND